MAKRVTGIKEVLQNLNKEIRKIENRSAGGLILAARMIKEDMEVTPPLTPVDENNLRPSLFIRPVKVGRDPVVVMGYTASYAFVAHEMVDKGGKAINWSRPGSGPKWFEAALNRNHARILATIRGNFDID